MTATIKLTIASDGERCFGCAHREYIPRNELHQCHLFDIILERESPDGGDRCQPCLDAEVKDG